MAQLAWFKFYPADFIGDTTHLTAEEVGAYMLLLMAAWRSSDGSIPDSDERLAMMARVSPRRWQKIKPTIMAFWSPVDNGAGVAAFRQKRLEIERKKSVIITEIKRQAGRASALKRQETGSTDVGFLFQLNANYQNQISEPESNSESCPPVAAREPLRDGSAGSRASGTVAHEPAADDGTAQAWKRAGFTSRDDWLARLRAKRAAKA